MEIKYYKYDFSFTFFFSILTIILTGIIILSIYGTIVTLRHSLILQSSLIENSGVINILVSACGFLLFVSPIFLTLLVFLSLAVTAYPSISIKEEGFKLRSLISETQWIKWTDLKKTKKSLFSIGKPKFWMIGVKNLNLMYKTNGLFLLLGTGGFIVASNIHNYSELIDILHEKRPDLFN